MYFRSSWSLEVAYFLVKQRIDHRLTNLPMRKKFSEIQKNTGQVKNTVVKVHN